MKEIQYDKIDRIEQILADYFDGRAQIEQVEELQRWVELSKENQLYFEQQKKIFVATSTLGMKFDAENALQMFKNRVGQHKNKIQGEAGQHKNGIQGEVERLKNEIQGEVGQHKNEIEYEVGRLKNGIQYGAEQHKNEAQSRVDQAKSVELQKQDSFKWCMGVVWKSVAMIFVFAATSMAFFYVGGNSVVKQFAEVVIEVPVGANLKFTLPDGSVVFLNSGSVASYSQGFGMVDRNFNLEGEGYFEVSKNKKLPFKVRSGAFFVKVLGTKFNYSNYQQDKFAVVSLIEGAVELGNGEKKVCELTPNQKAIYDKQNNTAQVVNYDSEQAKIWIKSEISFNEERLEEIVEKLKLIYKVDIELKDKELLDLKFYIGEFHKQNQTVEQILINLAQTGKINHKRVGNKIIITHKKY